MSCDSCKDQIDASAKVPHAIRKCKVCGREIRVCEPGEHGIGIRIRAGDQFTIPSGWLSIHPNPLKGRGHLTKAGLEWFAKLIFLGDLPRQKDQFDEEFKKNDALCTGVLKGSELLIGLDTEKFEDSEKVVQILQQNQD